MAKKPTVTGTPAQDAMHAVPAAPVPTEQSVTSVLLGELELRLKDYPEDSAPSVTTPVVGAPKSTEQIRQIGERNRAILGIPSDPEPEMVTSREQMLEAALRRFMKQAEFDRAYERYIDSKGYNYDGREEWIAAMAEVGRLGQNGRILSIGLPGMYGNGGSGIARFI
jgi:hypothetical protein